MTTLNDTKITIDINNRRPIKSRATAPARWCAAKLAHLGVKPNHISIASIAFATFGADSIVLMRPDLLPFEFTGLTLGLSIFATLFILGRLLCNLFDGMVAVEHHQISPTGEIWNDFPDRIADALLIVALGYAITDYSFAAILGWVTALLAILCAYTRMLGGSMGLPQDFRGPMAKPHRMALLMGGLISAGLLSLTDHVDYQNKILLLTLIAMNIGLIYTIYRRLRKMSRDLKSIH